MIESKLPLRPLDVTLQEPDRTVQLAGTSLKLSQTCETHEELANLINVIYFAIPALLAVEYADPPVVERVEGEVGEVPFRWELDSWHAQFLTTTQDKQEQAFAAAWERLGLLSASENRRLFAALHYFHTAARLARSGSTPGEFLAEMILNLAKVLEALFPPSGKAKSMDAVRAKLPALGFTQHEIERDYIPALALRNAIDVGHVGLSVFTREQLNMVHGYVVRAEMAFRVLLKKVLTNVEAGTLAIAPYDIRPDEGRAATAIRKMSKFASEYVL